MRRLINIAMICLLAALSTAAFAQDGYVTGNVNLRAGPDTSYPVIDTIPVGSPVGIQGCVDGWEWCDVLWGQDRGWVAGNYIQYEYNDQPVLLPAYGAAIGIPIVTFAIGDYWGRYYHNRPFYSQREVWFNRPYEHHAAPGPFRGPFHDYGREHGYGGAVYSGHGSHSDYRSSGPAQHYNGQHYDSQVHHNDVQHYNGQAQHNDVQHYNGQAQHNEAQHYSGQAQHNEAQHYNGQAQHNAPANHAPAQAAHSEGHHDSSKHDHDHDHGH
jgi:uncharacterized protein YraI